MPRHVGAVVKTVLGVGLYVGLLAITDWLPLGAGLMLTFPTLNGLALVYANHGELTGTAETMLWMPVLNGLLCGIYIVLYLLLSTFSEPRALALVLMVAVCALWWWSARKARRKGVAERSQLRHSVVMTILGCIAVMVAATTGKSFGEAAGPAIVAETWFERNGLKVALFVGGMIIFVLFTTYARIDAGTQGILGGLPIVPFGLLVAVAWGGSANTQVRLATLGGMATSVWLAAATPLWFIYFFSRYLQRREMPLTDRVTALITAWTLYLSLIGVIGAVMWGLT